MEKKHSRKSFLRILPKGFTTSEVLICVVIILILATLAIVGYTQVIDNAYQRVCATNQTIIMRGIERHFLTTGIAPATLGDINLEYWKDAYAEVMHDRDWPTKLSYFLVKITTAKEACADITKLEHLVSPAEMKVYGIMPEVFHCPADKTPESPSYGINTALRNYGRWSDVLPDISLIADCDSSSFSSQDDFTYRHKRKFAQEQVAQTMTKSMRIEKRILKKGKGTKYPGQSEKPEEFRPQTVDLEEIAEREQRKNRIEQRIDTCQKKIEKYQAAIEEYEQKQQASNTSPGEKLYYEGKIQTCKTAIWLLEIEIKMLGEIND